MGAKGPPAMNEEHDAATRHAALLGGVKCAWCTVIILESSTTPGGVLWAHGLCRECRRRVEEADALTTAPGPFPNTHDIARGR
jgi:hypothetical protein